MQDMTQRYRKFLRSWGVWFVFDTVTGNSKSLKTRDKAEALQKVNAMNETERQPGISLGLAKVYLNAADPKLATRTWQQVMDDIIERKTGETRLRWNTAAKDKNLDCIRNLPCAETRAEHFDKVLKDGSVSTNVYLRRIHNHALNMEWLLKAVIPRALWPRPVYKEKRAITLDEHTRIVEREKNPELKALYQLAWHVGGSQSDLANLQAEDIDWTNRVISFFRKKMRTRTQTPAQIRFGKEAEAVLRSLPATGPLFPKLSKWHEKHRAKEFKRRCVGLGIEGVTLHSYRYAWAERALQCGYPERFAQQALGHNSKAVHHAYAKRAKVIVPSLDDWVKNLKKDPQGLQAKVVAVDFQPRQTASSDLSQAANG